MGVAKMSVQEHKKYLRSETVKADKAQTVFCPSGIKANPHIVAIAHDTLLPLEKKVSCPFCLGLSEFRRFLVSTKAGISRSMGKCPLCTQGMYLKTLKKMTEWRASGYAGWVFNYHGFWKKISFEQWKGRLKLMGWTMEFWDEYGKLKEAAHEEGEESFGDYVDRKGREEAEAWAKLQGAT
jgi:hypothetical protein